MSNVKIKNALLSVSNKENLLDVVKVLNKFKIKIISSGGTYKFLKKKGYKSTEISKYTGFKEMLDGRVKTLPPKIHAGILHDRKKKTHLKEMKGKNPDFTKVEDLVKAHNKDIKDTYKKNQEMNGKVKLTQ